MINKNIKINEKLRKDNNTVRLLDIFGENLHSLNDIILDLPFDKYDKVILGFTPKNKYDFNCGILNEDDTTMFILSEKENIFTAHSARMPELSRA